MTKRLRECLHVILAAAWLGGCAVPDPDTTKAEALYQRPTTETQKPPTATPETFVFSGWLSLDVYNPPAGLAPKGIAFFVHGGAWAAGSRSDVHPVAWRMLSQGYRLVSVDYRLASRFFDTAVSPFPAQIHDVKRAIRWVKNRYSERPIIGVGHSAGGHLVALAGTTADACAADRTLAPCLPDAGDETLDGVINLAGPTDLSVLQAPRTTTFLDNAITDFLACPRRGDVTSCSATMIKNASPLTYYTEGDAPMYVANSAEDTLVPPVTECRLGAKYVCGGRTNHFWMDVIEAGQVPSQIAVFAPLIDVFKGLTNISGANAIALEHHMLGGVNTAWLDRWTSMLGSGPMPASVGSVPLVQLCPQRCE